MKKILFQGICFFYRTLFNKAMSCDPTNVYCYIPRKGDKLLENYYTDNTGIPGPLAKRVRNTNYQGRFPRTSYNTLKDEFIQNEYLSYADPVFREMRGAPVLPGFEIQQYNAYNMPADYFLEPVFKEKSLGKKENCGCGAKADDKHFRQK